MSGKSKGGREVRKPKVVKKAASSMDTGLMKAETPKKTKMAK
ncbi:hypothetical protein [Jatrophihabitans telluris]|nr:hypothetical protein [Jatrophihabitans telluris]